MKEIDKSHKEATANLTKLILENKMYQAKLEQLQGEAE